MSDTDRSGPEAATEGPKRRVRRGRSSEQPEEQASAPDAELRTQSMPPPVALAPSDSSSEEGSGQPDEAPAPEEKSPLPESGEHKHEPSEPPPREPAPTPPRPRDGGRGVAYLALALSILLPAGLYLHLWQSGVIGRDESRLTSLESNVASLQATPPVKPEVARADLDKLSTRIDALDKTIGELRQRAAAAPADASTASLAAQVEAAAKSSQDALAAAKAATQSADSVRALNSRLGDLDTRLAALEKQVSSLQGVVSARSKPRDSAAPILVMARAISGDLSSGVPYPGELEALARLGADPKSVEALRPFADKGAPSASSLASEFEAELDAARQRVNDANAPNSFWGRLLAALARLVHVRHIGVDEAGTPAGSVEGALLRGDIAAARDAWNALPVFEKGATPKSGARIVALAGANEAATHIADGALEDIRRAAEASGNGG